MSEKEDVPIRGPAWTDAAIRRTSEGTQLREGKGLAALQKEFSGFCSQVKMSLINEAPFAQTSKSNLVDGNSSLNHNTVGAFDFLDDLPFETQKDLPVEKQK